ncbi:hypothetical protein [Marivirga harenae]|uniref:hypothetical protein n=1 Tax=Marivirga harenae TaxID=2010992 RepID=UPI0026E0C1AB|nr:hypothetical protein [Marivirga harenae]WKV10597.1 hypothetical protein Q3Y49_10260 [Marivirga harenae]|tara:strand:- start:566368 stop:567033 length:666 start_codon:yes stop_codon:yes gene_type:complete
MNEKELQKIGGACAIFEGLIYIVAFIIYGAILVYPDATASANERLNFLTENHLTFSLLTFTSYILFGIVLVVLVIAIYHRLKTYSLISSQITSVFGVIWAGLVIAGGMIDNISLNAIIEMGSKEPENAMLVFSATNIITEGLGGGNEIVGGIWVLLLSLAALKGHLFSKPLIFLGILVGVAGILTIYPLDIFTEVFGIGQIFWFLWIGIFMIRNPLIEKTN